MTTALYLRVSTDEQAREGYSIGAPEPEFEALHLPVPGRTPPPRCLILPGGGVSLKPTGFVRKVDELGRLVIPMETRRQLGIEAGDGVEILVSGSDVVLQKYRPGCVFCGVAEGLERYRGKWVCGECCRLMAGLHYTGIITAHRQSRT